MQSAELLNNDWYPHLSEGVYVAALDTAQTQGSMDLIDISAFTGIAYDSLLIYSPFDSQNNWMYEDNFSYTAHHDGSSVVGHGTLLLQTGSLLTGTVHDDILYASDNDGLNDGLAFANPLQPDAGEGMYFT